jgi:hypothetical protein
VYREPSVNDFGLLIAYVLPGFTALWGTTYVWDTFRPWYGLQQPNEPTLGGFLFLGLASVGAGLTVSTLRWLLVDALHHRTGIRPPAWDFAGLASAEGGYRLLLDIHYRYYQFYANALVALLIVLACRLASTQTLTGLDAALLGCAALFYLGSRDSLAKYYRRGEQLLRPQGRPPGRRASGRLGR